MGRHRNAITHVSSEGRRPSPRFLTALRQSRIVAGLTQKQMGLGLGVSQNIITDLEMGKSEASPEFLFRWICFIETRSTDSASERVVLSEALALLRLIVLSTTGPLIPVANEDDQAIALFDAVDRRVGYPLEKGTWSRPCEKKHMPVIRLRVETTKHHRKIVIGLYEPDKLTSLSKRVPEEKAPVHLADPEKVPYWKRVALRRKAERQANNSTGQPDSPIPPITDTRL